MSAPTPAITDPSAYARNSNAELCQEAARRLCNRGMGLVAGEMATFKRGSGENHRLTFWVFGIAGTVVAILGACVR